VPPTVRKKQLFGHRAPLPPMPSLFGSKRPTAMPSAPPPVVAKSTRKEVGRPAAIDKALTLDDSRDGHAAVRHLEAAKKRREEERRVAPRKLSAGGNERVSGKDALAHAAWKKKRDADEAKKKADKSKKKSVFDLMDI